jgi:large subunit ribosomal protein L24
MKSLFNTTWKSSKQPRKQRKFLANAPNHIKRKQLSVSLDKNLKKKYERRTIEVKKDDEVKIMRGKFNKKQGKVLAVNVKYTKVQVEGIEITKKNGEKTPVWMRPSNLKIIKLDDTDKKRFKKASKVTKSVEEERK